MRKHIKKLFLSKETVRSLDPEKLGGLVGGNASRTTCIVSCQYPCFTEGETCASSECSVYYEPC